MPVPCTQHSKSHFHLVLWPCLPRGQAPCGKPRHHAGISWGLPLSIRPSVLTPFPSCLYLCFYNSLPKGKLPPRPGLPMEPQEGHQPSQDPRFPPASPPPLRLNSDHEKPGRAGRPVPLPFSQEQRGHGAAGVPPAPLPPAMGAVIQGAAGLEMAPVGEECGMGTSERGGGGQRDHPLPPPPKPEILRPEGVTTKFHSTDRKEIKSF